MMIDYRLKTFLTAARIQNLTKTGEELGLTQPGVSQHIKYLEEYFKTALFEKKGRGLRLTQAGKYLLKEAELMELRSKKTKQNLENFENGQQVFTIGATLTIGEFIIPEILGNYKKQYSQRVLQIKISNTNNTLKDLQQERIDLAVVEGTFDKSQYLHEHFFEDELIFVTAPGSPWSKSVSVDIKDLTPYSLILREPGSGTREIFERYLRQKECRIPPEAIHMEVGSLSAIKSLCEASMGCTIISRRAVQKELKLGTLVEIPLSGGILNRELQFVFTKNSPSAFVQEFIDFCRRNRESINGKSYH